MDSISRPSSPCCGGSISSIARLIRRLASAMASGKDRPVFTLVSIVWLPAKSGGPDGIFANGNLLDLHLGFFKLAFTMALERNPALIGRNRLIQLAAPVLDLPHDLFQLVQRVFKAQRRDIGVGCGCWVSHGHEFSA